MNKIIKAAVLLFGITVLSNCGGGATDSNSNIGSINQSVSTPLTIDMSGTVPIIGSGSTTSVIYVHNNTNNTISGISYSAVTNISSDSDSGLISKTLLATKQLLGIKSDAGEFLSPASIVMCSTIPAHQSCPLVFNTPILDSETSQGSAIISANYSYLNVVHNFDQVINYLRIDNQEANGALFASGTTINGYGNDEGYATVYLYGSGVGNIYTITSMVADKPGVKIIQGDITGRQLQSNFVQAVEVSANTGNANLGYAVSLTATSIDMFSNSSFNPSVSLLSVPAIASGAILTPGSVPLINSASASPSGTLQIVNSGNASATGITVGGTGGVSITAGGCQSIGTLASGASCTVNFTVPQVGNTGTITVSYGNKAPGVGDLSQSVTWYNNKGADLLTMSSNQTPITFNATQSGSAIITVGNIGGFTLTGLTFPTPVAVGGSAVGSSSALSCGSSLAVGSSCTFNVSVTDNVVEQNTMQFYVQGSYTNESGARVYKRALNVRYVSNPFAPSLSITPLSPLMTVIGDGTSFVRQSLTVTNNGNTPATIPSFALSGAPSYLTIESGAFTTCVTGGSLNVAASCLIGLKLGPVVKGAQESGITPLNVNYYGGTILPGSPATATNNISYNVLPGNESLILQTVTPGNQSSGSGTPSLPYIFTGNQTAAKSITLTYQNVGIGPIRITGINNTNLPYAWLLDTASSTCDDTPTLAPSATCTLVFRNVLGTNIIASPAVGSVFTMNLTLPNLVFVESGIGTRQYNDQPSLPIAQFPLGGTILFVTNRQATVVNNATESSSLQRVVVQQVLANGVESGVPYAPFTVTSTMESYYIGTPVRTSGCIVSAYSSSTLQQTCTLAANVSGVATESVTYTIANYNAGNRLHIIYQINPANQAVLMSPIAALLQARPIWYPMGSAGFSVGAASFISIEFSNLNQGYVAYQDAGLANRAVVKRYNSTTNIWESVGGASVSLSAESQTSMAISPVTNMPYVAYSESGLAGGGRATVKAYNNGTGLWESVGAAGFSPGAVQYTSLAFNESNNRPYIAYRDGSVAGRVTVKSYNSGTGLWESVGPAGFSGTAVAYVKLAFNPANNQPYVAFESLTTNRVYAMTYDGSSWSQVGSAISTGDGTFVDLKFNPFNNQPYVSFRDSSSGSRLTVSTYNGSSWIALGGAGGASSFQAIYTSIAFDLVNGKPYVAFREGVVPPINNSASSRSYNANTNTWGGLPSSNLPAPGVATYEVMAFNPFNNQPSLAYSDNTLSDKITVVTYWGK